MSELSGGTAYGGGGGGWLLPTIGITATVVVALPLGLRRLMCAHASKADMEDQPSIPFAFASTIKNIKFFVLHLLEIMGGGGKGPLPEVGDAFFDVDLITTDGKQTKKLSEFMKAGRSLVLNFGSCSCPPFRANVRKYEGLVRKYSKDVDFLCVYIAEAHAKDEWSFGETNGIDGRWDIEQPKTIEARCEAAREFVEESDIKSAVMVDPMDNKASKLYHGFPERHHIIKDGKFTSVGPMGPFFYDLGIVEKLLEKELGY